MVLVFIPLFVFVTIYYFNLKPKDPEEKGNGKDDRSIIHLTKLRSLLVEMIANFTADVLEHPRVQAAASKAIVQGMNETADQPDLPVRVAALYLKLQEQNEYVSRRLGEQFPKVAANFLAGAAAGLTKKGMSKDLKPSSQLHKDQLELLKQQTTTATAQPTKATTGTEKSADKSITTTIPKMEDDDEPRTPTRVTLGAQWTEFVENLKRGAKDSKESSSQRSKSEETPSIEKEDSLKSLIKEEDDGNASDSTPPPVPPEILALPSFLGAMNKKFNEHQHQQGLKDKDKNTITSATGTLENTEGSKVSPSSNNDNHTLASPVTL